MSLLQGTLDDHVNLSAVEALAGRLERHGEELHDDSTWSDGVARHDLVRQAVKAVRVAGHLRAAVKEARGLAGGW